MLDDGETLEIVRVATDGARNACSMLYGSIRKSALGMGYLPHRILTYTLKSECGSSLRASGFYVDSESAGGREWSRPSRLRNDHHPTDPKIRWTASPHGLKGPQPIRSM